MLGLQTDNVPFLRGLRSVLGRFGEWSTGEFSISSVNGRPGQVLSQNLSKTRRLYCFGTLQATCMIHEMWGSWSGASYEVKSYRSKKGFGSLNFAPAPKGFYHIP